MKQLKDVPDAQGGPQLPETPFNGIIVSMHRTEAPIHGSEYPSSTLNFAIASEDDASQNSPIVFCEVRMGIDTQPLAHLREGDKVRVTKVQWEQYPHCVVATGIVFDPATLVRRYLREANFLIAPSYPADAQAQTREPETPFNGVVISVNHSLLKIGSHPYRQMNIAIMSETESPERPLVAFHLLRGGNGVNPTLHLRPGHKVKVRQTSRQGAYTIATAIEFDHAQFAQSFRARSQD